MGREYELSPAGIRPGVLEGLDQARRQPGMQTCVDLIEQKNPTESERRDRRTDQTEPGLGSGRLVLEIEGAPRLRLFHGLPGDPFAGIMPDADEQVVSSQIAIYDEPILICGHTHQPLNRTIAGLRHASHNALAHPGLQRILNPGSVGMPYNGVPRAHYLLLDLVKENGHLDWQPRFQQLEYDHKRVACTFHSSGLLEACGAIGKLNLRTIQDGLPWASDYGQWVRNQPQSLRSDPEAAVDLYLQTHGPSQWAFGG